MAVFKKIIKCCFERDGILYFILTLSVLFTGCNSDRVTQLTREWYVTQYTPASGHYMTTPTSILRLYGDETYTQYGDDSRYSFGRWSFNREENLLIMKPSQGKLEVLNSYYVIDKLGSNHMKMLLYRNVPRPGAEELAYTLTGHKNKDDELDPYKRSLQQWRIAPKQLESIEMIRYRVRSYLMFLKTLYQHAIANELQSLRTSWYPNPIQFYFANGVRMAYSDELQDWNRCFYDSAQAVRGYQFISGPFMNVKLKKTKNRLERNLDVIEQVLKGI